jgi:hypothetical protein
VNQDLLKPLPLLGERHPGKLVIWHSGNMPGTTAAICPVPETQSAVIVLQNSLGLCDVADLRCQAVIDTLFLGEQAQDYRDLASRCIANNLRRMDDVEARLRDERVPGTVPRELSGYVGRYFNRTKNWFIDIGFANDRLYLEFLGREEEQYALRHYHYDSFV